MKQLLTCTACITEVALQATYSGWQVRASFVAQLVRACTTTQLTKCCCRVCGAVLGPQNYCGSVHATHHLDEVASNMHSAHYISCMASYIKRMAPACDLHSSVGACLCDGETSEVLLSCLRCPRGHLG